MGPQHEELLQSLSETEGTYMSWRELLLLLTFILAFCVGLTQAAPKTLDIYFILFNLSSEQKIA
jgi:hypothetical protein